jgi:hypothetical protein
MTGQPPDDTQQKASRGKEATSVGAGGAAASPAHEPPEEAVSPRRRRSDRISMMIPIDITATASTGERFTESCYTEMVSVHGASIVLS